MFVIQSLPRCGTHLLRTALSSHGEITCFGEVFNPGSEIHGYPAKHPTVTAVMGHCMSQSQQTGFVAHAYVGLADHEIGPGLDLAFRRRADVNVAHGLWDAIPRDTPVVTLYRENLLERYVSQRIAERRQVWLVSKGEAVPPVERIRIDCGMMFKDFARTEALMSIAQSRFPNALRVSYEQLVENADSIFGSILEHIGAAIRSLIPGTSKVGWQLGETIVNYCEVRSSLGGTRFEAFVHETTA
ncbi:MAG: hypothetical protein KDA90_22495 [Planctomycetaceae bacterium]|nr:hypothetical protein [Planctomycetaceae bacterium]